MPPTKEVVNFIKNNNCFNITYKFDWHSSTFKLLNLPSQYLQGSQQIHNLNRFTKYSEAKTFQETCKTKFYAMASSRFIFNEWCIKNALINTREFSSGEYSAGELPWVWWGRIFRGWVLPVPFLTSPLVYIEYVWKALFC